MWHEGPPAGHVDPRRMIAAQLEVARLGKATVVPGVVSGLEVAASGWTLYLDSGTAVTATGVVIAAGPHTGELAGLGVAPDLRVRGETVVTASLGPAEQDRLAGLPSVLTDVDDPVMGSAYLVPPTAYPDGSVRIKLGATRHVPRELETAESRRRWMAGNEHAGELDTLRRLLLGIVPGLHAEAWETKPCLLTDTPTGLPYVDVVGDRLVVAAGCNGYAAKSGDAIGELAARLAITGRWRDEVLAAEQFALVTA